MTRSDQNSSAVPRCSGGPKVGARHARPAREERAGLRVAPLPPRTKRGAFDPPCAPWRAGRVGTRGVPTHRRALAARRRTRGWEKRLVKTSDPRVVDRIGFLIPGSVVSFFPPAVEGEISMSGCRGQKMDVPRVSRRRACRRGNLPAFQQPVESLAVLFDGFTFTVGQRNSRQPPINVDLGFKHLRLPLGFGISKSQRAQAIRCGHCSKNV